MARLGGLQYLAALALYILILRGHVQALQLVRNGIPYRAGDEVQFIAPNISVEAPEGLEIDRNASPIRVEVPIDLEIQKQDAMAGKVASMSDQLMQQVLAAKNTTGNSTVPTKTTKSSNTTLKDSKITTTTMSPANKNSSSAPSTTTAKTTETKKSEDSNSDSEKGPIKKGNSASSLKNFNSYFSVILSMSLAICIANKMFFI